MKGQDDRKAQLKVSGLGRKPNLKVPPFSCETHSHIYGPVKQYPLWPGRLGEPICSIDAYNEMLKRLGFDRAVIVQPSAHGSDNRCTLDAISARGLKNTRGVCVTKRDVSSRSLQRLHDQGIRGLRFFLMADDFGLADALFMAKKIAPLGWHIQFQDDGVWLEEAVNVFETLPVDCVIDHIGRIGCGESADTKGFKALLKFFESGRCWIKLSAPYYMCTNGHNGKKGNQPDYGEVSGYVRALAEVRPDRLVWAANWPHPQFPISDKPDEANCLDVMVDWIPDEAIRRMIFVDNPARLYDFQS